LVLNHSKTSIRHSRHNNKQALLLLYFSSCTGGSQSQQDQHQAQQAPGTATQSHNTHALVGQLRTEYRGSTITARPASGTAGTWRSNKTTKHTGSCWSTSMGVQIVLSHRQTSIRHCRHLAQQHNNNSTNMLVCAINCCLDGNRTRITHIQHLAQQDTARIQHLLPTRHLRTNHINL
jgi:hypothetical protein